MTVPPEAVGRLHGRRQHRRRARTVIRHMLIQDPTLRRIHDNQKGFGQIAPRARPRPDDRAHARTRRTHDGAHPAHMTHSATAEHHTARPRPPPRATPLLLARSRLSCLLTGKTRPTRTSSTRWRDEIRAQSAVRLSTCAPSAQQRNERAKMTAAKRNVDIASGHLFGDADATSCATFLIPMETACCHERTSLQHGRGLVPPERTMSSRVAPAVNSACQRFSK